MIAAAKVRSGAFALGLTAIAVSIAVIIGSYLRAIDTSDYFKQADEARPWISWGFNSAGIGLVLSFFGRKWYRAGGVAISLLLLAFWIVQMESLL